MNKLSPSPRAVPLRRPRNPRRRGAMLILIAVLLVLFLACVAFSVDIAYMELVNAELRSSTDAAAKAAVTTLNVTNDVNLARQAARKVAGLNLVAGQPLFLDDADIVFGQVKFQTTGRSTFLPGVTPFGAARIDGRKLAASASGSVPLFFGSVLGRSAYEPQLVATATRLTCDVCLVLDRANSMRSFGKLTALKAAVPCFLDTLNPYSQQIQLAQVSFGTTASVDQNFTSNFDLIRQATAALVAGRLDLQFIGNGMNKGRALLLEEQLPPDQRFRKFNQKIMVLAVDGYQFVDEAGTQTMQPEDVARQARDQGIVIHTITIGSFADNALMGSIANLTGGSFHPAPVVADLPNVFRAVAEVILASRTTVTILTQSE
ncbi:MAG: VWA domain-containing protein [Planctomycetota bacterium]|nr:VWA domain-containing protein [Planctomycetota bacterium]